MTERLEDIFDPPPDDPQIEIGTAGWDDREEHFEKGEVDDDGHDFVFVTLYRGRDASKRPLKGVASGYKIRCTLAEHVSLPKKGARVYVALPAGYGQIPGAGVIFAVVGPGLGRFTNLKDNAKTFTSPNGTVAVVLNDDGTCVLRTKTADGYDVFFRVAPDGFTLGAPFGTLKLNATGFHLSLGSGATINVGGIAGLPSPFDTIASYIALAAGSIRINGSVMSLGAGTKDALAKTAPLEAYFTSLLTAIGTALTATAPGGAAAATAFAAAMATATTTLTAALPSTTSSS